MDVSSSISMYRVWTLSVNSPRLGESLRESARTLYPWLSNCLTCARPCRPVAPTTDTIATVYSPYSIICTALRTYGRDEQFCALG